MQRASRRVVPAALESCEIHFEDVKPGNHDRHLFEDTATGLKGYRDGAGRVAVSARYPVAYEFGVGGVAAVVDGESPFIFIDPSGRMLARAYAMDNGPDYFQEGIARIVANEKIGFMTDRGRIIVRPRFDRASSFCHGQAEVTEDGVAYRIDKEGRRFSSTPSR